jgi:hypothetical protein
MALDLTHPTASSPALVLRWQVVGPEQQKCTKRSWVLLLSFVGISAGVSSIPVRIAGYVSYLPLGIAVWVGVGAGMAASSISARRASRQLSEYRSPS